MTDLTTFRITDDAGAEQTLNNVSERKASLQKEVSESNELPEWEIRKRQFQIELIKAIEAAAEEFQSLSPDLFDPRIKSLPQTHQEIFNAEGVANMGKLFALTTAKICWRALSIVEDMDDEEKFETLRATFTDPNVLLHSGASQYLLTGVGSDLTQTFAHSTVLGEMVAKIVSSESFPNLEGENQDHHRGLVLEVGKAVKELEAQHGFASEEALRQILVDNNVAEDKLIPMTRNLALVYTIAMNLLGHRLRVYSGDAFTNQGGSIGAALNNLLDELIYFDKQ